MERITVAIAAHDSNGMTQCKRMLRHEDDITVLCEAGPGEDLVTGILRLKPRILLLGADLCSDDECAVLETLRRDCPETLVVLVAQRPLEDERLANALATGARGYLGQEELEHRLAIAVHGVHRGETWVPRKLLGKIMDIALP